MLGVFFLLFLPLSQAKTKVFVVPHSHSDAGWLINVEDSYNTHGRNVLNNIFNLLNRQASLKFCWAEILYLSMWLSEYPEKKPDIIKFIQQGRFEIVGGGWVQNDEALPDFELVLHQMEAGFEYIRRELNVTKVPVGWQIDPYGHSSLTPSLFSKLGMNILVFARLSDKTKYFLADNGNLQFVWKTQGFAKETEVFTHVLQTHYSFPDFIRLGDFYTPIPKCYANLPGDESDTDKCVADLEKFVQNENQKFKTENYFFILGNDFSYNDESRAEGYFKLWENMSLRSKNIDIVFATPSEYFKAVFDSGVKFDTYEGDFFPSVVVPNNHWSENRHWRAWTGFYSTMPHFKRMVSEVQKDARNAEILATFLSDKRITAYELAISTHHDAITGTAKHEVRMDYIRRLERDKKKLLDTLGGFFKQALKYKVSSALTNPYQTLIMFNPLNWKVKRTLRLEVFSKYITLKASTGGVIPCQVVPINEKFYVFFLYELQSTQIRVVFIEEKAYSCSECCEMSFATQDTVASNSFMSVNIKEGLIYSVSKKKSEYILNSRLVNYHSPFSGVYLFTPTDKGVEIGKLQQYTLFTGSIVQLAFSEFLHDEDLFTQLVILSDSDSFELVFELNAKKGTDIFLRFDNKYKASGWFYTFNSADLMRRYYIKEDDLTKGTNQYPISGGLIVDLGDTYLSVFPSFALGAGMVDESSFELNLHRNPAQDDQLGINEYVPDGFAVSHSWLITLETFSFEHLWKSYISHKASPSLYYLMDEFKVTEQYSKAENFTQVMLVNDTLSIFAEDPCKYVSSAVLTDDDIVVRVLNLCERNQEKNWLRVMDEVNLLGMELEEKDMVMKSGKFIELEYRNNSGQNVVRYHLNQDKNKIGPFEFRTFKGESERVRKYIQFEYDLSVNEEFVVENEKIMVTEIEINYYQPFILSFIYLFVAIILFFIIKELRRNIKH